MSELSERVREPIACAEPVETLQEPLYQWSGPDVVRVTENRGTMAEIQAHHAAIPEIRGLGRTREEAVAGLFQRLAAVADWAQDDFHRGVVRRALDEIRLVLDGTQA
jgi:hypothetical protein